MHPTSLRRCHSTLEHAWTETWWSPELEGLKRDARTKKGIRNAAPAGGRRGAVQGGLRRAVAEAQTILLCTGWRDCGTASTGSSGKRKKPGGCPIKTDSGQVIGPDESATSLAETFSLMTVSILTIRIIRKSEGEPTGSSQPPEAWGSARVDPPLPG
ncbi:hypothetical protein EVAR_90456_1 [Eumeta japonica]|uniref:Uncharacterized protein n=1 Tax=Eumeta variegata TaxID=151549 RepID=A0A4C1SJW7_EUMVA|nr:hypothetical protein EVAR_90456_1 [Eumeta japonica]